MMLPLEQRRRLVAVIAASPNRRLACAQAGIHPSDVLPVVQPAPPLLLLAPLAGPDAIWRAMWWPWPRPTPRPVPVGWRTCWPPRGGGALSRVADTGPAPAQHPCPPPPAARRPPLPGPEVVVLPAPRSTAPGRLTASRPGELVQMDTFHVGSFKETRLGLAKAAHGQIWQYTAIDVASSWLWAELATTAHNPSAALTSALAHLGAADLAAAGGPWGR